MDLKHLNWSYFRGYEGTASLLQSICLFRSHVLYDSGFRKNFGSGGASYGDVQYSDFESYHIVASKGDEVVGTIRITPPGAETIALSVLGSARYQELLGRIDAKPSNTLEINRLMIDERFRKQKLGQTLMYAAVGLIENLWDRNQIHIIGSAGNCTKQVDFFLKYTDYQRISDVSNEFAEKFNDEVSFMSYAKPPYVKGAEWVKYFTNYFKEQRQPAWNRFKSNYDRHTILPDISA